MIVQSVRDMKINNFLWVPCCSGGFAFTPDQTVTTCYLSPQSYTNRGTETTAPSCDQSAGTIHRLNSEREIAKTEPENEYWSLGQSPMFWYQSALYGQFYYFDGFSVFKKGWCWHFFLLYIIVKEKELVKIEN